MPTLLRTTDVEAIFGQRAQRFRVHVQRQAIRYTLALVLVSVALALTVVVFWFYRWRVLHGAARPPEEPVEPFSVQLLVSPEEAIAQRWVVRIGPERPFARWHPRDSESPLSVSAGRTYRLRSLGDIAGQVEDSFAPEQKPESRSEPTRLPPRALASAEGVPIIPEESVLLFLLWIPDHPDEAVTLVLDELTVSPAEYREYLARRGVPIRPVYLDDP